METSAAQQKVAAILNSIDIPSSAYDRAYNRYRDLGDWFHRSESQCSSFSPRIYPQGSFRLGTVVRPMDEDGSYDLDVGCRLESGILKATHTQADVKELVGQDLEAYREARQIQRQLDEKRRCWRLDYADELSFHMDVVPSIPEEISRRKIIQESMVKRGTARELAHDVTQYTGAITDNAHPQYRVRAPDWRISNSEGYARWFESRIRLCQRKVDEMAMMAKRAQVEELPIWQWKSPLQEAIQILKCHRDNMFKEAPDSKPISVILTTLAGEAYRGEWTTATALERILADLDRYVLPAKPRVPNPVNPAEDFADKWYDPDYSHLRLEANFGDWLRQARADLKHLMRIQDLDELQTFAERKFGTRITQSDLDEVDKLVNPSPGKVEAPHIIAKDSPRPWRK